MRGGPKYQVHAAYRDLLASPGAQRRLVFRAGRGPVSSYRGTVRDGLLYWIPACAGMTSNFRASSTPQQDDRQRHQRQREQYAQQRQRDAQRVGAKDADERFRGAFPLGRGVFGANTRAALLLVFVQRP